MLLNLSKIYFYLSFYVSVCLPFCLSNRLCACLSASQRAYLSACFSICISICLSVSQNWLFSFCLFAFGDHSNLNVMELDFWKYSCFPRLMMRSELQRFVIEESKVCYNKEIFAFLWPLKESENIDSKSITGSKKIRKMIKSIFSSNTWIPELTFLVNGDTIVPESDKATDLFNNYVNG